MMLSLDLGQWFFLIIGGYFTHPARHVRTRLQGTGPTWRQPRPAIICCVNKPKAGGASFPAPPAFELLLGVRAALGEVRCCHRTASIQVTQLTFNVGLQA